MRREAVAFVALNAADAALTLGLLGLGAAREGNPVMAAVLALGAPCFVAVKLVGSAVGALFARGWMLWALLWAFVAIVVLNAAQLVACLW